MQILWGERRGDHIYRRGCTPNDAEDLGGLEVDDHLDFCDLLHGEVRRFLAFENAPGMPGIDANLVVGIAEAAAIAHQAAGQGVPTVWEDRGQRMAGTNSSKNGKFHFT